MTGQRAENLNNFQNGVEAMSALSAGDVMLRRHPVCRGPYLDNIYIYIIFVRYEYRDPNTFYIYIYI